MPVPDRVIPMEVDGDAAKRLILNEMLPLVEESGLRAVGEDIIMAVYIRANQRTAGGIIVPDTNREDEFQGKIGLVISMGPLCQGEQFENYFAGKPPKVGDWIGINVNETKTFVLGKRTCRSVEWRYVRFMIDQPDRAM